MESFRLDTFVRSLTAPSSRRGLISGVSATALALAATRLPLDGEAKKKRKKKKKSKKQTRVDAMCTGPINDAFGIIDLNARLAQSFTAIASGKLVRAELRLTEPAASSGDYVLRLSPLNGAGQPTNDVLAETTVPDGDVPTGQSTVTFEFANPFVVEAGTNYALVVTRPGSDKLVWVGQTGNGCTGTAYMSPSADGLFLAVGNIDFNFTTFVCS